MGWESKTSRSKPQGSKLEGVYFMLADLRYVKGLDKAKGLDEAFLCKTKISPARAEIFKKKAPKLYEAVIGVKPL